MAMLRVVIFTGGGLGVEIADRIAGIPGVVLVGIVCERPPRKRYSLRTRWDRNLRYRGLWGTVAHTVEQAIARLRREPAGQSRTPVEDALRAIAKRAKAHFVTTADLHSPEVLAVIAGLKPDLGVVVGTTIIKPALYEIPRLGSINLHQGKVPAYRGSAICFWSLYNDEPTFGITIHQVVAMVDAGDVIKETTVPFAYDYAKYGTDFASFEADFAKTLAAPSVHLMVEAVRSIAARTATRSLQDESKAVRRRKPTISEQRKLRAILRTRYT